jgi:secreted trypsin-like serine protease
LVTTVTSYTEARNRALIGGGYDGVVRVVAGSFYGTGVLLYNGQAVLTAAHLFSSESTATSVVFETNYGTQTVSSKKVLINPDYNSKSSTNDLALVWLSGAAPINAERYELYRSEDEINKTFTMVGYGRPGTGSMGELSTPPSPPLRLQAKNQFDTDISSLLPFFSSTPAWASISNKQLVADFDDGTSARDALGLLAGKTGLGLGSDEGLIAPGDSGGPAFIGNKVVGVASFTADLKSTVYQPDIDKTGNSSYGELAVWMRVSTYQQWIDQNLRSQAFNAPKTLAAVQKTVVEGNSGTSFAYFWVQLNGPSLLERAEVSVDYKTRDGTAKAGQDYIAVQGRLNLYSAEDHAVVAVEILGDYTPEPSETFELEISNPLGAAFQNGQVVLTAIRTIVNDDGIFG